MITIQCYWQRHNDVQSLLYQLETSLEFSQRARFNHAWFLLKESIQEIIPQLSERERLDFSLCLRELCHTLSCPPEEDDSENSLFYIDHNSLARFNQLNLSPELLTHLKKLEGIIFYNEDQLKENLSEPLLNKPSNNKKKSDYIQIRNMALLPNPKAMLRVFEDSFTVTRLHQVIKQAGLPSSLKDDIANQLIPFHEGHTNEPIILDDIIDKDSTLRQVVSSAVSNILPPEILLEECNVCLRDGDHLISLNLDQPVKSVNEEEFDLVFKEIGGPAHFAIEFKDQPNVRMSWEETNSPHVFVYQRYIRKVDTLNLWNIKRLLNEIKSTFSEDTPTTSTIPPEWQFPDFLIRKYCTEVLEDFTKQNQQYQMEILLNHGIAESPSKFITQLKRLITGVRPLNSEDVTFCESVMPILTKQTVDQSIFPVDMISTHDFRLFLFSRHLSQIFEIDRDTFELKGSPPFIQNSPKWVPVKTEDWKKVFFIEYCNHKNVTPFFFVWTNRSKLLSFSYPAFKQVSLSDTPYPALARISLKDLRSLTQDRENDVLWLREGENRIIRVFSRYLDNTFEQRYIAIPKPRHLNDSLPKRVSQNRSGIISQKIIGNGLSFYFLANNGYQLLKGHWNKSRLDTIYTGGYTQYHMLNHNRLRSHLIDFHLHQDGFLYLLDQGGHHVTILSSEGEKVSTIPPQEKWLNQPGNQIKGSMFDHPVTMSIDNNNYLYILDNQSFQKFRIYYRKVFIDDSATRKICHLNKPEFTPEPVVIGKDLLNKERVDQINANLITALESLAEPLSELDYF